jgi:N-acetyl-anhydromuramyl-L-alanine amidase AmpD
MHSIRGFKRTRDAMRAFNPAMKSIGYHFVIEVDGNIALGRGLDEIGAHVQGSNAHSIGVCMIGTDEFSEAQWNSLKQILITICSKLYMHTVPNITRAIEILHLLDIRVLGHRDYSPDLDGDGIIERNEWLKICPGFDVAEWLNGLS